MLLKDDDVQKVLTMSMTLEALEETQKEIIRGNAATMGRIDVYLPCERAESYYISRIHRRGPFTPPMVF